MDYVRVATFDIKQGSFDELAELARTSMLPTLRDLPGFIRYGFADTGNSTCLSISFWETRRDADASVRVAANWVRENAGNKVEMRSNLIGDLAFFEGVPAKV